MDVDNYLDPEHKTKLEKANDLFCSLLRREHPEREVKPKEPKR